MNFNSFRIKTTLASLAILAGTIIPASPTFAQNIPINAVYAGTDIDGTPMYVCAGIWSNGVNNGVYPGKSRSGSSSCDISYGGLEYWVSLPNSVVLTYPIQSDLEENLMSFYWESSSNVEAIPVNALPTGFENGHSLYSCRASYNGYYKVGKLTPDNICYFGFSSIEQSATSYDVLAVTFYPGIVR